MAGQLFSLKEKVQTLQNKLNCLKKKVIDLENNLNNGNIEKEENLTMLSEASKTTVKASSTTEQSEINQIKGLNSMNSDQSFEEVERMESDMLPKRSKMPLNASERSEQPNFQTLGQISEKEKIEINKTRI